MLSEENPAYLHDQLITYIGNKRALLPLIENGLSFIQQRTGRNKFDCLDMFSGSGFVSRVLKKYSHYLAANDLEQYAYVISRCYLADSKFLDLAHLQSVYEALCTAITAKLYDAERSGASFQKGFIERLYAPSDDNSIRRGERCFYTPYNARYIDTARTLISECIREQDQFFFIAPLLSEASIHANTAGIFKGFYKNSQTGCGQFGGNAQNALDRIRGKCSLPFPVFSSFSCASSVFQRDATELAESFDLYRHTARGCFDIAYLDPPYNQHPYGSNYFMLNLISSYTAPDESKISRVSGIPNDWHRSLYNKRAYSAETFENLVKKIQADYLLVSFNSEGFISREEMTSLLAQVGSVTVLESPYNTFRGSRNLRNRSIHVSEYLFVVEKHD